MECQTRCGPAFKAGIDQLAFGVGELHKSLLHIELERDFVPIVGESVFQSAHFAGEDTFCGIATSCVQGAFSRGF